MIHIFRSLPLSADARTSRNISLFSKEQESMVYTWEKSNSSSPLLPKTTKWIKFPILKDRVSIFKNLDYLVYIVWVAAKVLIYGKRDDTCIFMDLETIILAYPVARLKGCNIVFDVVDPFSQTKIKQEWLSYKIDALELWYINHSNYVLFPHASREQYYIDRIDSNVTNTHKVIIENVPDFNLVHTDSSFDNQLKYFKSNNEHKIIIGYFGTLDSHSRGLEYLIEFCKKNHTEIALLIAGQGSLNNILEEMAYENIYYIGSFSQNDLPILYQNVDFTWAYYSTNIELHKYAAPNKYYEHLAFQTPIITSNVIPQAIDIKNNCSGIFISCEDKITPFTDFLVKLKKYLSNLDENKKCFKEIWNNKYKDYYKNIQAVSSIVKTKGV